MRKSALSLLAFLAAAPLALAGDAGTSQSVIEALPAKFKNGIMKISADNGTPEPPEWYVTAKNRDKDGLSHSITVVKGQITSEKPTLNLRGILQDAAPINLSKVTIDSTGAWNIAAKYAAANGKVLGNASYALEQKGRSASPIWSVWCYDPSVSYLGLLTILASDGTVLTSEGFPKSP